MSNLCPVCDGPADQEVAEVRGHRYFQCRLCGSLSLARAEMDRLDAGEPLIAYTESYWRDELPSARERSFGTTLARLGEAVLYARRPIQRFIDVGTGPGYLLDALAHHLPGRKDVFYGVEKYPPPAEARTSSPNYIVGDIADLPFQVDAGICMEVFEHLTPRQLRGLLEGMAKVSHPGALFIINTGLPEYVLGEDLAYLDPIHRGHVASYSLDAVRRLAQGTGFRVLPIAGKTWAYVLELAPEEKTAEDVRSRIWSAPRENVALLCDEQKGSVLYLLGRESARAWG
jgi:SAM-dependent methyltransferase